MKKSYTKPMIEIEVYELSAAIAASCGHKINLGPGVPGSTDPDYQQCSDFAGSGFLFNITPELSIQSTGNVPFYADGTANCDCYYTSGGGGYFTS